MNKPAIQPEGPRSEWKVQLPAPERTARSLCAFANGTGGHLWVGIGDDGRIVGVDDVDTVRAEVHLALDHVTPPPTLSVLVQSRSGKTLVCVEVHPLENQIAHVLGPDGEELIYLREADTNRPASRKTAKALQFPLTAEVGPSEKKLMAFLEAEAPLSMKALGNRMRMSERRIKQLMAPLLRAGLVHDREPKRYCLTALGSAQLNKR